MPPERGPIIPVLPPDAAEVYEAVALLGSRGYGDAWLARHRQLDREAAFGPAADLPRAGLSGWVRVKLRMLPR